MQESQSAKNRNHIGTNFSAQSREVSTAFVKARFTLILAAALIAGLLTPLPTLAAGVNKSVSEVCKKSTNAAFREKYCTAAKDLKKGYMANFATSAVWAGVSTTCSFACGKPSGAGTVCTVASVAGSASEGIMVKKFSDSLMSEGQKLIGKKLSGDAPSEAAAVVSDKKVNGEACMTAGKSALKAFEKYSNSKENMKSLDTMASDTKKMDTQVSGNTFTTDSQNSNLEHSNESGALAAATANATGICGENSITTALGAIQCAVRNDPTLPSFVNSEKFVKELQTATGKPADAFFAGFQNPGSAIAASPALASLGSSGKAGIADSMSAMERYSELKASGNIASTSNDGYRSGGAARPSAPGSGDDFDMNGALAGMLGQLNGGAAAEIQPDSGVNSVSAGRAPANAVIVSPEDRKVSIFDRVQWRYGAVSARQHLGGEFQNGGNSK